MLAVQPTFQVALSISALIGLVGTPLLVPSVRGIFSDLGTYAKVAYAAGVVILVSFALSSFGLVPILLTLKAIAATLEVAAVFGIAYGIGLGLVTFARGWRPAHELNRVTHASLHIGAGLARLALLSAIASLAPVNEGPAIFFAFGLLGALIGACIYFSNIEDPRTSRSTSDEGVETAGEDDDAQGDKAGGDAEAGDDAETTSAAAEVETLPKDNN